jgi:HJR/Mrr/RecB family endonuclease
MKHYKKKLDNTSFIILSILVIGLVINYSKVFEYILLAIVTLFLIKFLIKLRRYIKYKLSHVDAMTGLEFEKHVAKYLRDQGYKTKLTEKYDLGIDIVAVKGGIRYGVQVKRHKGVVGANAVRQAVTALNLYDCDRAMVITNNYFSKTAIRLALSNDCILLDRDFLLK